MSLERKDPRTGAPGRPAESRLWGSVRRSLLRLGGAFSAIETRERNDVDGAAKIAKAHAQSLMRSAGVTSVTAVGGCWKLSDENVLGLRIEIFGRQGVIP
jgi:hypothetical protein